VRFLRVDVDGVRARARVRVRTFPAWTLPGLDHPGRAFDWPQPYDIRHTGAPARCAKGQEASEIFNNAISASLQRLQTATATPRSLGDVWSAGRSGT